MNGLADAITGCTTASDSLRKSQQGFDFVATHNPHHAAYERLNTSGTVSHIQARGAQSVRPEHQVAAPKVNLASITKFSSGMTSITELKAGTSILADSGKVGLGIDIGLLTVPAMKALANGIVNHRARVFIDSGAFSLFRKNLKSHQTAQQLSLMGANEAPEWKTMDFEKVLAKYEAVMDAIDEANPAEEPITPPYFVMPDIIGDQEGTADLYRKHRDWISGQIQFNPNCIVPLQVGAKTLADAYREIVGIIGVDQFVVGIPSQEEAVSNQELTEFLREIKPKRVHFLGAVAEVTLAPRIEAVNASGHIPDISADGNILRSKLYGQDVAGNNRHEKVATVLKQELDLSEVYSRYLDQRSPTMPHKDLSKAIALGAMAVEMLQKSHESRETAQQEIDEHKAKKKKKPEEGTEAEEEAEETDLKKAVSEVQGAADELLKSHVKEHTRTSASGAVSQVSAYDDKRQKAAELTQHAEKNQSKLTWNSARDARVVASDHATAAHAHVEAMKEATTNEDINHHMHAASRHFAAGDSMHSFASGQDGSGSFKHADHASDHARELSEHADNDKSPEDTAEGLNKKVSLHMLAMEQHQRAEGAHHRVANESFDKAGSKNEKQQAFTSAMADAAHHRGEALRHGKEVQRISQISIGARSKAIEASEKAYRTGKPEDHKAAADLHREAIKVNYDSEGAREEEKQAQEHDKKAEKHEAKAK